MKLEYLAVYGRASVAAFRQLSTHGQKFDPESLYHMSLFNLKLCTHIWSTNINFRPPPYIGLFGPSWSELSPLGDLSGEGRLGRRQIFLSQTET